jgi:GT2 family glycosyltransferase
LEYIKGVNRNYNMSYYYIEKSNNSYCSVAKNIGWKKSTGKFIVFIDSDIIVKENYLSELDRYFNADENVMIIGTRIFLPEEIIFESVNKKSIFNRYADYMKTPSLLEQRYHTLNRFSYNAATLKYPWLLAFGCNMVLPLCWIEKLEGFDENFRNWGVEDNEFAFRLFKQGVKIVINSKLDVLHQFHSNDKDAIDASKYAGIEENAKYFFDKHPDALDMPRDMVINLFKGFLDVDFNLNNDIPVERVVLELKDESELSDIKSKIIKFSGEKQIELIVNDYLESTDLDVWIQLLGQVNSTPKYFPVSKRL